MDWKKWYFCIIIESPREKILCINCVRSHIPCVYEILPTLTCGVVACQHVRHTLRRYRRRWWWWWWTFCCLSFQKDKLKTFSFKSFAIIVEISSVITYGNDLSYQFLIKLEVLTWTDIHRENWTYLNFIDIWREQSWSHIIWMSKLLQPEHHIRSRTSFLAWWGLGQRARRLEVERERVLKKTWT